MQHEQRYTRFAVAMHWIVAAVVLVQYPLGWLMQQIPKQPPGQRAEVFNLHKSIGLTLLALMIVRLGWRLAHRPPAYFPMPRWQERLARTTHVAMYVVLIALPLAGYLGSAFSGYPVRFFGLVLPSWAPKNAAVKDWMSSVHLVLAWTLAAALALHMAGVVKHVVFERDGLLRRMGWARAASSTAAGEAAGGHLRA
ncbi:MAG TPA: cytochrome b [Usitatibacter sp.]|jgi:cytochrome b561|nr:cytochrome b [Usitatibacter sp.]